MDGPDPKRRKKSDKAKEKYELNGGFTQKHIRLQQTLMESRSKLPATNTDKKAK